MEARVRLLGHPVHPMLVMFPGALLITGTVFDVVHAINDSAVAAEAGFWTVTVGIIGAVLAAVTGFADWTKIPGGTRAKRVGQIHGLCNAAVLVLFVIAWITRVNNADHATSAGPLALQIIGVVVLGVSAWLGGELVDRMGIGVAGDAHPDAPSSLSAGRPVRTGSPSVSQRMDDSAGR